MPAGTPTGVLPGLVLLVSWVVGAAGAGGGRIHEAHIGYAGYFRAGIGFQIYPWRGIETRFMGQKCHRATLLTHDHDPDTPPGVSRAACFILIFRDNLLSSSRGIPPSASTTHDLAWRRQPGGRRPGAE
jgi:hypothetical protein